MREEYVNNWAGWIWRQSNDPLARPILTGVCKLGRWLVGWLTDKQLADQLAAGHLDV